MNNSMLEYKGYHATITYDADDELFIGEVFGINDSLSFHGSSILELKTMFKQSIDNYLELCQTIGKEPEKEFKGTFNVRISPELHKQIATLAAQKNISLNQCVSNALKEFVVTH
ncbi:MAG: type II toxin-antitoxin system HicB family antitoxin [Coprobacillus cateniformis]|jgi:predicted HicB family RNase H-like nuclease|nr:type II toxin-antitoxin system HicB family antitoxin [Coprobacillus cateniformis]